MIIHLSTPRNEKIRELSNIWIKNHKVKGKHPNARYYIPVLQKGGMVLLCPDTGKTKNVPKDIINDADNYINGEPLPKRFSRRS